MQTDKFVYKCDVCGSQYQHGPHRYEGHMAQRYGMMVCDICWRANWDGWAPHHESRIAAIAAAKGLPLPPRNKNGLLPRE